MSVVPSLPLSMQKLVAELSKLPSIGEKSATRLAYYLVSSNRELAKRLATALQDVSQKILQCERCFFLSEEALCTFCRNSSRDASVVCVVEKPMDVLAMERTGEFRGYYHVLHGLWAPLKGQGPDSMKLKELVERCRAGTIREVILATGATVEGDATAIYIARILGELGIATTRLAQGISKGAELEYADDVTLSRALAGRRAVNF